MRISREQQPLIDMAMMLDRRGFVYMKDYDVADAPSYFLDNRKCSYLIFGNKRTYEMFKLVEEEYKATKQKTRPRERTPAKILPEKLDHSS